MNSYQFKASNYPKMLYVYSHFMSHRRGKRKRKEKPEKKKSRLDWMKNWHDSKS